MGGGGAVGRSVVWFNARLSHEVVPACGEPWKHVIYLSDARRLRAAETESNTRLLPTISVAVNQLRVVIM